MEEIKIYNQYMYSYPHKKYYDWVESSVIKSSINKMYNSDLALYFHIPFCSTKCGYCNLFSITNLSFIDEYVEAMCRQIEQYSKLIKGKNVNINNIIFGGGTPFILSERHFESIFKALDDYFGVDIKNVGFDIETSPKETEVEKLKYLLEMGVNRISIGVQSFEQSELDYIYRSHKTEECKKALGYLKEYRPKILNIDIIYGIPNQDENTLRKSINEALSYKPSEVFLYPLYIREGTGLVGCEDMVDSEKHALYKFASDYLKAKGYKQTSMRRFTDSVTYESSNCGFEKSLAFGCGGRSYIEELHFCEVYETGVKACSSIIESYIEKIDFTENIKGYVLNSEELARRFVIKNLGYYIGVSKSEYYNYFGKDLYLDYRELFDELFLQGYIAIGEEFISLTEKGLGFSDYILPKFASEKFKWEN